MYLEKSSISTRMYRFPALVLGVIGPQRSSCTSSSALVARYVVALGNYCLACFPSKQDPHTFTSVSILGIPITISHDIIDFIASRFI